MTWISEALEGPGTLAFFRAAAILKLCNPLIIIVGVLTSRNIYTCVVHIICEAQLRKHLSKHVLKVLPVLLQHVFP